VLEALDAHPWRLDTPLVFPSEQGDYLSLHSWRREEWRPALESAGLPRLVPYAMRHTFAAFAIAAGMGTFHLARTMGTSMEQIDKTYGHLLPESEEYLRGLLDSYDDNAAEAAEGGRS
jgi:integrase